MSLVGLTLLTGVLVLVVGLLGHLLVRDHVRRIVALNVASGGVMMVLLALALRGTGATDGGDAVDPDAVPQALVLTGIVIMAAVTALALALARRVRDADEEDEAVDDDGDVTDAEPDERAEGGGRGGGA
ncbi:NADH-quinone oxidoreductase subunit K [Litorihabitans aurantiacus]|uniref:Multicomponent Na+:H+ antiporter subunit C n=1 Tax=Litorihabitans aurantiacus TaxID=1930061 RepID=A0AA37UJ40_9MICO|nr:NADH-quinone oxidoreductase subunit K [Litorihabitans aurantiacus]GMA31329.1 hypothetical protein GCM10025875_13210 [Litorihabitans aurantiacus]